MDTQNITFDVQWQVAEVAPIAPHEPSCEAKSRQGLLLPCWSYGGQCLRTTGSANGDTRLSRTRAGIRPQCQGLWARSLSAAAACAVQMQAVQTCMRHVAGFRDAAQADAVQLLAPAPSTMQMQALGSAAGSRNLQLQAAAAMALLRVAAVESGDMHRWQARFFTPMADQPMASPEQGAGRLIKGTIPAAGHGLDAFGVMTHAGMHVHPRLLPTHGGSAPQAANALMSNSCNNAGLAAALLNRVVISGGMGALGALVATWMVAAHGRSRPMLIGRSGRFPPGSTAPFTKVRHSSPVVIGSATHICAGHKWLYIPVAAALTGHLLAHDLCFAGHVQQRL